MSSQTTPPHNHSTRSIGQQIELLAVTHLSRHGLDLIAKNWACRYGEIDLIFLQQSVLVFVEVRYRRHHQWGGALESITLSKQQRLITTAELFLQSHPQYSNLACRFDAVIVSKMSNNSLDFNWIQNAFGV